MKGKRHPWPTDGVTRKYVDRVEDRLLVKITRLKAEVWKLKAANRPVASEDIEYKK